MKRTAEEYLVKWKDRESRKPLIIRGARQTGKTYLVEQFAKKYFERFFKVDFEFDLDVKPIFQSRDPKKIINELAMYFDTEIIPNKTLVFFDEIQACPEAIASLRYFFEKMPELHVVAAGSLIDFALKEFAYTMPVGRIEFLYLNPMSFEEFVLAVNPSLYDYLCSFSPNDEINDSIHQKLSSILRDFFFVGGMPEVVASYLKDKNFIEIQRIQTSILTTMQNDFAKYGSRKQQEYLIKTMRHVPANIGKKIKYTQIDKDVRSNVLKDALNLLSMSKIIRFIYMSKGNGVPLDAEVSTSSFKALFLDIGLVNNICGLKLINTEDLITVYEGGLAEQFVGQELLNLFYPFEEPMLYYWSREEKNSNAEIDYLITHQNCVIPVEVKAGTTGSLKSLHVFLYEKKLNLGLRLNLDKPSIGTFNTKVSLNKKQDGIDFTLFSLPLYLAGQINRLLLP